MLRPIACAFALAVPALASAQESETPTPTPSPTPVAEAGMQEIEVLEAKPVTAASSEEVLRRDLDARSLFTPEDVFRVVPNIVVGQHAGGGKADQLFVRGFDADHHRRWRRKGRIDHFPAPKFETNFANR